MSLDALRAAVVAEARTWIGTPYHHRARVKGAGVDCAMILIEVYAACGVIENFDTGDYPGDWMMHRDDERYIGFIAPLAEEYDPAAEPIMPGDIVVWRYARTYSHGGIVTVWPKVVHAFAPFGVVSEDDASIPSPFTLTNDGKPRPMRAFRLKGLLDERP